MQLEDVSIGVMRPDILVKAARICIKKHTHNRLSTRLLGSKPISKPDQILQWVRHLENELENARKCGSTTYDMKLHIQVMAALLQELSLISQSQCSS